MDREKRIIWRAINARGSEHDSSAFKDSGLYSKLESICLGKIEGVEMMYDGIYLYLIGDSAYALRPFLLCPYDKAQPGSAEDVFNFMLSSNRIFVECAFGEIDRRFGIFWRPLQFNLSKQRFIIDACLRIHNFIIDFRIRENCDDEWEKDDENHFSSECISFIVNNPEICVGVYGNGSMGSGHGRGRPSLQEKELRGAGTKLRYHFKKQNGFFGTTEDHENMAC